VEFQDRDYPRRPWKLTHTRGIAAEETQARNFTAADSFDLLRPQQTTVEAQTRAPRFRTIPIGEKLTVQGCTDVKKAADSSAWDMHRPIRDCPPPWAHVEYPRARFVQAAVMSASPYQ
jgi:hypothetical protein